MTTETKATHTPGPLAMSPALPHLKYTRPLLSILTDNGDYIAETINRPDEQQNARLLTAAWNSYDKQCGPNAIQCAEGDLLGEALDVCRRLLRDDADGEYTIGLIEDAEAVLAKAKGETP